MLAPSNVQTIGQFREKDFNNFFDYSINNEGIYPEYPHIVWVGHGQRRFAIVKKTVAILLIDEDVVEKWQIKDHKEY